MIEDLLSPQVQQFIRDHEHDDPRQIVLKNKMIGGVPAAKIAEQIIGRSKAKEKLPLLFTTENIIYPPTENLEQCSSEITAKFKTEIIHNGKHAVDLTGGLGIDTFFLSKSFSAMDYVERNPSLFELVVHNHKALGAENIHHHLNSAESFVAQMSLVDLVFIDPSRRVADRKVFTLSDSEPDIISLQEKIFDKSEYLLVKASPLLDIKRALEQLQFVQTVYVVAVDNEVKELLFLSRRNFSSEPEIQSINLIRSGREIFSFKLSEEENATISLSGPYRYLYEPNAAILKAGAFKMIAQRYNVGKLHPSTHLYTSNALLDFPGRIFEIISEVKPDKRSVAAYIPEGRANVSTRNYPLSPDELRKKTGLADGGEKFLIGFSCQDRKVVVAAKRLK